MATSEQSPSAALLRLRAADVIRICGLNASAVGLELASNHCVIASQRDSSWLLATVMDGSPCAVSVEVTDDADAMRWSCDCAHAGPLACKHVAAMLSAWIAHPSDFLVKGSANSAEVASEPSVERTRAEPRAAEIVTPSLGVSTVETLTLAGTLARMSAADIDVIARRVLGADIPGDTSDIARAIVVALSDPGRPQALLKQLERPAQSLLAMINLAGGAMTAVDLEGLASRIGRPLSAMQSDIAVLERHALLLPKLPTNVPSQHGPGATWRHVAGWRIADEVRRALATPLPLEALPTQRDARLAPPVVDISGAAVHAIRSTPRPLCLALALLAHAPSPLGPPRDGTTIGDDARNARQAGSPLAPGELESERLNELARVAGIEPDGVRLARRLLRLVREQHPAQPLVDMARVPVAERPLVLRDAFRRWVRADSAAELLDLESLDGLHIRYATAHPAFRQATIASEVGNARRFVARLLSHAQPETWYSLEDFLTLAWQIRPGLLRGQQHTWATPVWWIESATERRTLQPLLRDDWMAAEGAFIRLLVTGSFATWGALDLAAREDGSTVAFRLTPFGVFLLQRANGPADASLAALCDADWGPPVLPLREGALAVQPLAAGTSLLDALALWATPTAVSGKRLIYILSTDRACAAFDQRLSPESLIAVLRPLHSRAAESVASQLNQWQAKWGRTRLTTGFALLEANDEASLVEALAAAPDIAARCRQITPTVALAHPSDAELLRTLLTRRGYTL